MRDPLNGAPPLGDRLFGTVEVEQTEMAQSRGDDEIGWITGEAAAGNPNLHDVNTRGEHFEHRGHGGLVRR